MSITKLPEKLLYNIFADIITEYIDKAITSPPHPFWLARYPREVVDHVRRVLVAREVIVTPPVGSDHTEWTCVSEADFVAVLREEVQAGALEGCEIESDDSSEDGSSPDDSDEEDSKGDEDPGFQRFLRDYTANLPMAERPTEVDSVSDISTEYQSDTDDSSDEEDFAERDATMVENRFALWRQIEASERLPPNTVAPLVCINGHLRGIALNVLFDATGIKRARKQIFNKRFNAQLHSLRMNYRLAHTSIYVNSEAYQYTGPMTTYINAYLQLGGGAYLLHSFHAQGTPDSAAFDAGEHLVAMRRITTVANRVYPAALRPLIQQRAQIYNVRLHRFVNLIGFFAKLHVAYQGAMAIGGTGDDPVYYVLKENALKLRELMDELAEYDARSMDQNFFVEMPDAVSRMPVMLRQICRLRRISELREDENMLSAARTAGELRHKWNERKKKATTLFVNLS